MRNSPESLAEDIKRHNRQYLSLISGEVARKQLVQSHRLAWKIIYLHTRQLQLLTLFQSITRQPSSDCFEPSLGLSKAERQLFDGLRRRRTRRLERFRPSKPVYTWTISGRSDTGSLSSLRSDRPNSGRSKSTALSHWWIWRQWLTSLRSSPASSIKSHSSLTD